MFVAHYAANNEYREFGTFDEAKKWLADAWEDDGKPQSGNPSGTIIVYFWKKIRKE